MTRMRRLGLAPERVLVASLQKLCWGRGGGRFLECQTIRSNTMLKTDQRVFTPVFTMSLRERRYSNFDQRSDPLNVFFPSITFSDPFPRYLSRLDQLIQILLTVIGMRQTKSTGARISRSD